MSGVRFRRAASIPTLDPSRGVLAALRVIGADATRRVPVGQGFPGDGTLRDSQVIRVKGNTGGVGYTAPSAIPAHERLDVAPGNGQRKYLEAAANANRAAALKAIAGDIRQQLGL